MRVVVGSDHGGVQLKKELVAYLRQSEETETVELGASDVTDICDYPDVARSVCSAVLNEPDCVGVLVCGTGIGISIAANKVQGIRCALVHDAFTARMAKEHNNANVLAVGGRVIGAEVAKDALRAFLDAKFQGGRHQSRIDKIE